MGDVRLVEIAPLVKSWVRSSIEEVGGRAVIVRSPFHKVIRNVKRGRVWTSVLEINDDYLYTVKESARCGRNA